MGLIDSLENDKLPFQILHLQLLDYYDQNIIFKTPLFLNEIFLYLTKISFITIILIKKKINFFFCYYNAHLKSLQNIVE